MSDTMSLEMRVTAHDDASPVIRKIMAEVRRLQATVRKSFENPAGKLDLGLDGIKSAAANQRTESNRTAISVMRDLNRVSAFQERMRRQAARESNDARHADAAGQADAIRDLRDRMRFGSRMAAQKLREEKDVARETAETRRSEAAAQAEALRSLRERMSFVSRMTRHRVSEERAAARDIAQAERERARETRDNARLDARRTRERDRADRSREREHERDRNDFTGRARDAGHRVSDAYTRSTRAAAGVGAAGAFGTGALVKRSLGAETSVDDAEIATRQYGGLSKSQARDLRDNWAAGLAEQLGVDSSKLLGAWTDAVKLGIPVAGAKDFAGLTTKTSEAWGVGFDKVKDTLGTVNTILTSDGSAFDIKRLKSVSNTLQHLAAKQSTTPEKLIEFLSQGAGASQILGASQEAGLAFGSASTSLGNKAGESGRLYDYIASRIVEMPRLTKKKGDDGKYSKQLMQDLGYGTAENMDSIRRSNPDAFLPDFMDRFSKINDPKKQEEAIHWFSGREWMGEFGRMVKGAETYREAEKLRQEAKGLDAIGEVWETHKEKLSFVFKQFKAGWLNILGEFGKELSPLARQAGDFFLGWTKELRSGGLAARFKAAIQGAIEGLGFRDLPGMLRGIFGNPGEGGAGSVETWKAAAFGFADGIRSVGAAIKGAFSAFAGANASPETIARLTGQIIALAGACVVIAPVVGVIGSIATALGALALAATSAWRVIGGAGIVGGAAAGAGAAGAGASATAGAAAGGIAARLGLAGAGASLMSGIGLAIVAEIGANRGTIATSILTAIKEFVTGLVPTIVEGVKEAISALVAEIKSKFTIENLRNELIPAPLQRWLRGASTNTPAQPDQPQGQGQSTAPNGTGPARAYASGGYVSGPGGPRSDSIRAWLSNGEFVMNADAVRQFRPYLEAMNGGRIPDSFFSGRSGAGEYVSAFMSSGRRGPEALGGIRFDPASLGNRAFESNSLAGGVQIRELIRAIEELVRTFREEIQDRRRDARGREGIRERARISETARQIESMGVRTRIAALAGGVGPMFSGVAIGTGTAPAGNGGGGTTGDVLPRDNSGIGGIVGARPGERLGEGSLGRRGIIGGQDPATGGRITMPRGNPAANFAARAPALMERLQRDLNLTREQAAGLLGNLGHESAGFTQYQEGRPTVPGSRGGAGWAQWTGARRRQFEAWAQGRGLDPRSDEANYGFLVHELQTSERSALARLRRETTVEGATRSVEQHYERPGVRHTDRRIGYARQAYQGGNAQAGGGQPSDAVVGGLRETGRNAGASAAVDTAESLLGAGASQSARALGRRMSPGRWCADFVNGALSSAGMRGVNGSVANSFMTWGREVTDGVRRGDVLVENRGGGPGSTGGHVGMATGQTRIDRRTGREQVEMISGNYSGAVGNSWVDRSRVIARRVNEAAESAADAASGTRRNPQGQAETRPQGGAQTGAQGQNRGEDRTQPMSAPRPDAGMQPSLRQPANNPLGALQGIMQGLGQGRTGGLDQQALMSLLPGGRGGMGVAASLMGAVMNNIPAPTTPEAMAGAVRGSVESRVSGQAGGRGGSPTTISAPITIQGITSPEAVANRAASHIQNATSWRTHDQDFEGAY